MGDTTSALAVSSRLIRCARRAILFDVRVARARFALVAATLGAVVAIACGGDESSPSSVPDAGAGAAGAAGATGGAAGLGGSGGSAGAPDASGGSAGAAASAGTTSTGGAAGASGSGGSSGALPTAPSCEGLANDCGAGANDDCCASIAVPAGSFTLGRAPGTSDDCACSVCGAGCSSCGSLACGSDELGVAASVSAFRLDRYEVTVGRFRKFVEHVVATGWKPTPGAGKHSHLPGGALAGESGWDAAWPELPTTQSAWDSALDCSISGLTYTWTPAPGANERRPVNCLTWYRAYAFCIWDGGFLPTEAEWEYVASGGEERVYPWSVPPGSTTSDPSHASYDCLGDGVAGCSLSDITEVGTKSAGDGRWLHADLAGNLWELVLDAHAPSYAACADCVSTIGSHRVIRGGVYNDDVWAARAANRHNHDPAAKGANVGVRCARAP